MSRRNRWSVAACLLLAGGVAAPLSARADDGSDYFEQHIRPILTRNCYACHSGDTPKGGLSIDTKAGVLTGGRLGAALTPGDPDASLLIKAVRHAPGAPSMPPGSRLSDAEISELARWIRMGAPDPRTTAAPPAAVKQPSWALKPLRKVAPPTAQGSLSSWPRTPIDRFILARLLARGLKPSPVADRRTLIRRATYDLTGLPPSPAEVAAFEADRSSQAYSSLIDRLLASPQYGEKWGRHWLDLVHYGDTHGYDKDKRRDNAWPYRDYVIAAFNRDMPYSRFVREQIAGDVLYPDDPQAVIATGMLAAGPWDFVGQEELAEGTVEKEKTRLIDRDDMVSTVMSTFDSVTIHCARCHNHKFDPIPQRDYYRLQAVFAGIDRRDRPYYDSVHAEERRRLDQERADALSRRNVVLARIASITSPAIQRTDAQIRAARAELAEPAAAASGAGSPSNGYHSDICARQDVSRWVQVDLGAEMPIDVVRLIPARPTDFKDTPGFGFPLRYRVSASADPAFQSERLIVDHTAADVANPGDQAVTIPVRSVRARYVRVTATRLWPRTGDYVFALAEMQVISNLVNVAAGKTVTAERSIESGRWSSRYLVDNYDSRNRLPNMSDPGVTTTVLHRDETSRRLAELIESRTAQVESLVDEPTRMERTDAERRLAAIDVRVAAFPPAPLVYAAITHAPRPIWVLNRGDVEQHGERVRPGALSAMPGLNADFGPGAAADEGVGRAALANWILDRRNTLTWRSIVNRVWQYHFSRGIVDTPSDFGNNGAKPSHPELLDWLADWFLENGQSIKKLHRLIMLSSVYMQSSAFSASGDRADADNRLLWRMNRRRLEAEEIRDSVLAVSGTLNLKQGGPGFELFRFKDDHSPVYDYSASEKVSEPATFRRTIYEFTVRSVPDPFLECLDAADPNALTPVRSSTLTALQALSLRNDPFIVSQSRFFAARLEAEASTVDSRLDLAFRLLYSRLPSAAEHKLLGAYTATYGQANTCRLLLNTNEFMFID